MSRSGTQIPVIRQLPSSFSLQQAFARLCALPGCLWLDSASPQPTPTQKDSEQSSRIKQASPKQTYPTSHSAEPVAQIGRYSFLTADPMEQIVATASDPDPWPRLDTWCRRLPPSSVAELPPFQGGIAGMIGYESASWLEQVGVAANDDLPTPAMSIGYYDWTIALDHQTGEAWIISQGFKLDGSQCVTQAMQRADQIEAMLADCTGPDASPPSLPKQLDITNVTSNFTSDQFRAAVADIVRRIHDGDSFQVNLAQRLLHRANLPSPELYRRLRQANPAPFAGYYDGGSFTVMSSSPERFFSVDDGLVQTRPIKGTIRRSEDAQLDALLAGALRVSEKDYAENVMIVDLMRNDLSRVCTDDSVQVCKLCEVERYQYVQHLVSVVEGRLRAEQNVVDLLRACFPGGSVTGAPKIEAMRTIAELEPNPRGPYCGSLGYISSGGRADFNILIRTITAAHGVWQIPVGGGITAQSDPKAEEKETWAKAEGMLRAVVADSDST